MNARVATHELNDKCIIIKSMQSIIAEPKIHFYEFMEIEILHEYMQTGIEYMVKSFLNANNKFISLRYFSHEIATLISALKDIYFLIMHKGIYAENFYGLERTSNRSKLSVLIDVIVWILLPYLSTKLEAQFNLLKQKQRDGTGLSLGAKAFLKLFPVFFCFIKVCSVIMKFRYLMQPDVKFYNLRYLVGNTQLSYIEQAKPSPFPIISFLKSPGLFFILIAHKIASFAFSSEKKGKAKNEVTFVEAPIGERKVKQCPICGKKFKNPAVLQSSGYVFCYACIVPEVRKQKKCPLSQIPSDQSQIQIIYQ